MTFCIDLKDINYAVTLTEMGHDRVRIMALIRARNPDLSLRDLKSLVDNLPATVLHDVNIQDIRPLVRAFWQLGATVTISGPFAEGPDALSKIMWPGGVIGP